MTGLTDHRNNLAMLDSHPHGSLCKPIDFHAADRELALIVSRKRGESVSAS